MISNIFAVKIDRRVHITKTTLDHLGDKFEVEPGNGSAREQYLADHKIETFLIVPPKVSIFQVDNSDTFSSAMQQFSFLRCLLAIIRCLTETTFVLNTKDIVSYFPFFSVFHGEKRKETKTER